MNSTLLKALAWSFFFLIAIRISFADKTEDQKKVDVEVNALKAKNNMSKETMKKMTNIVKNIIPCPNTTDKTSLKIAEGAADAINIGYQALANVPFMVPDAISAIAEVAQKAQKCLDLIREAQQNMWENEKNFYRNLTSVSIQRMQSAIDQGFRELHQMLGNVRKEIRRGNEIMDEVDRLTGENKYRRFKVKLEILMEKFQKALDATEDDVVAVLTFIEMCNSVQNNDKYLIQELDEVVSMEKSTYIGISMHLKYFKDSVFLQAFHFIDLLTKDLRAYRTLCYLKSNMIQSPLDNSVSDALKAQVKGQIQQVYGKIVALNKQREQMYFNKENLFPAVEGDSMVRLRQAAEGSRGYDPYLNNNYVLFDTRNYTVYKRYRYSIEFGDGMRFHDSFTFNWQYFETPRGRLGNRTRFESMGIPDPFFSVAYDRQHVSAVSVDIAHITRGTVYEPRLKMHVIRSRINKEEYDIPPAYTAKVEATVRSNANSSPKQLLKQLWCEFGTYQLIGLYTTPANVEEEEDKNYLLFYPSYGLGNCHAFHVMHGGQRAGLKEWIACFFVADSECSEDKRSKFTDYAKTLDM